MSRLTGNFVEEYRRHRADGANRAGASPHKRRAEARVVRAVGRSRYVGDTAPALIDTVVAGAAKVEEWVYREMVGAGVTPEQRHSDYFDGSGPRLDVVAETLTLLDRSWKLAAALVEASERGSRPEWLLEDLIANSGANLYW